MEKLEKLRQWLQQFPGWGDIKIQDDDLLPEPGNAGLYPKGLQERGRSQDLLGNTHISCREQFLLRFMTEKRENAADWLRSLQDWIQQQSARGLAPTFGDIPSRERVFAEKGCLKQADQTGTCVYEVMLVADFMKVYEVKE